MTENLPIGLVSVSFRPLSPKEILDRLRATPLSSIEWGGDVHVPPTDPENARAVRKLTEEAGVKVCAYGSYYRTGVSDEKDFTAIAETAAILGAPLVRVWAGDKGSKEITEEAYARAVGDTKRICAVAAEKGLAVAFECHNNTLTDDYRSALRVLHDVGAENLYMYWQPNQFKSLAYNLEILDALSGFITNVHVFNWEGKSRFPLAYGLEAWRLYLEKLSRAPLAHQYLLEFMPHDDPAELPAEAAALQTLLKGE